MISFNEHLNFCLPYESKIMAQVIVEAQYVLKLGVLHQSASAVSWVL